MINLDSLSGEHLKVNEICHYRKHNEQIGSYNKSFHIQSSVDHDRLRVLSLSARINFP